jgi:hypothetical protein
LGAATGAGFAGSTAAVLIGSAGLCGDCALWVLGAGRCGLRLGGGGGRCGWAVAMPGRTRVFGPASAGFAAGGFTSTSLNFGAGAWTGAELGAGAEDRAGAAATCVAPAAL